MCKSVLPLLLGLLLCVGCSQSPSSPRPDFDIGEIVELRVDGSRAQVVNVWYDPPMMHNTGWHITCRIGALGQKHRDGLLSRDTTVVAYSLVNFREYELIRLEDETTKQD